MSFGEDVGERLREAACVGDLNLLSKLVSQGVDVNSKNGMNEWTALHWACKRNHVDVARYLLERGADKLARNKDGHVPAQLTSHEDIRQLLNASSDVEVTTVALPITPNYLANPVFPHVSKDRDYPVVSSSSHVAPREHHMTNGNFLASCSEEIVLKARLANSDDKDFVEIELPRSQQHFSGLLNLLCVELGVDKSLVAKIRKLPDTIVRKDKDVKRLTDFQELELVLTNKAVSASSRTYCLGPARNSETILY